MALKDTFTIHKIDINKELLQYEVKTSGSRKYWNNECKKYPTSNNCKIYCD